MEVKINKLSDINNIDFLVDNSLNGTAFAYEFFLKLKKVKRLLCVYDNKKLVAFFPLFEKNKSLEQSTMYIPYGGPVLLFNFSSNRKKLLYTREVLNKILKYLKKYYNSISFSFDPYIKDIISCVKNGFVPEVRYTYKINLSDSLDSIFSSFCRDRKRDIKSIPEINIKSGDISLYDFQESLKWEYNYGPKTSEKFVKKYIEKAIENKKGECFIAVYKNKVIGGICVVWDKINCYIMYSYYNKNYASPIPKLYFELIKYLKKNNISKYLDFEGSVFQEIENWNLSFGSYQELYFNFYYEKNKKHSLYEELYDYGDKNEKFY